MEVDRPAPPTPEKNEQYKPGVGSSYRNGWRQMWKYFGALLPIFAIYLLISFGISYGFGLGEEITGESKATIWNVLTWATSILVISPLSFGFAFSLLKAARDSAPGLNDLFAFMDNYWNTVLANVLMAAIVVGGFVILLLGLLKFSGDAFSIMNNLYTLMSQGEFTPADVQVLSNFIFKIAICSIPSIILVCKLAFVPYIVVGNKTGAFKAIRESWRLTSGYTWIIFFVYVVALPILVAGALLIVGIFLAMMWITMAQASLYQAITSQQKPVSKPENAAV